LNEFLLGLGDLAFAIAGLVTFVVEYVLPDTKKIARNLSQKEGLTGGEVTDKAENIKRCQRSLFFVPWILGMLLSAFGLMLS